MHAMTIDGKYGVPTVSVHTDTFVRMIQSVTRVSGMPRARRAFVPQPVMGKTPAELRAYVDGADPTTKRPFMQEVIEGLTKAVDEDFKDSSFDRTAPRLVEPDTEENLHQLFLENNWTDKLPIVLPTEERVAAMLKGTSRKPHEIVGHMRPTEFREWWEYDVEKIAVNAAMAGAKPEYMPVILALGATNVTARRSTTSSAASMAVVNGPIRNEIRMNCGTGALAPYNHANATIGRCYGIMSQNLQGGSVPGLSYMGTTGNNYAYNSVTFAENEERSPWAPFHVQHGFKPTDSTVSVFERCRATVFLHGLREKYWEQHLQHLLRGLSPSGKPVFLLDPLAARAFITRGGFDTKEKLIQWAYKTATMKASEYWDLQTVINNYLPLATSGEEPYASRLAAQPDEMIPMFKEDEIEVVVVGGETREYLRIIGANYEKTVSVDVWR